MTRAGARTRTGSDGLGVAVVCAWTLLAAFALVGGCRSSFEAALRDAFADPAVARSLAEHVWWSSLVHLAALLLL